MIQRFDRVHVDHSDRNPFLRKLFCGFHCFHHHQSASNDGKITALTYNFTFTKCEYIAVVMIGWGCDTRHAQVHRSLIRSCRQYRGPCLHII